MSITYNPINLDMYIPTFLLVVVLGFRPRMIWSAPLPWVPSGSNREEVRFVLPQGASVPAAGSPACRRQLEATPWSGHTFGPAGQTCSSRWAPDRDLWPVGCAGRCHRRKRSERFLPLPRDTSVGRNLYGWMESGFECLFFYWFNDDLNLPGPPRSM